MVFFVWFIVLFGLVGWLCFYIKDKFKWLVEILVSVGGNLFRGKDLEVWCGVVFVFNFELEKLKSV